MPSRNNTQNNLWKKWLVVGILFSTIAGAVYINNTWDAYKTDEKYEAIKLAQSAAALIEPEQLLTLNADISDLDSAVYKTLKRGISEFKNQTSNVDFAYLTKLEDGKLYFMVDSEQPGTMGYSPPGQQYDEATEQDLLPYSTGEALLTDPLTDRWGTWVSALVPIKNPATGVVIAVFGVDYPAAYWKAETYRHILPAVAVVICVIILFLALYHTILNNISIRMLSNKFKESEALFKAVFEQAPVGIALVNNYEFRSKANVEFTRILSRTKEEIAAINWTEITHPDDLENDLELFARFKAREISEYTMEKRYIRPDGSYIWVQMVVSGIQVGGVQPENWDHVCIVQDISEKKKAEDTIRESERSKRMLLANLQGMAYRCRHDKDWTMTFISEGCYGLTGYKVESLLYNRDRSFNDIILPEFRETLWNEWERTISLKIPFRAEYEIVTATGEHKWVLETAQSVRGQDGSVEALEGIIIDITESKKRLDEIQYINDHDYMTGLYNRRYFELEKARLENEGLTPISVIMADINGVRLINDAFGHAEGDRLIMETARIMQSCCRQNDLLARTGGDDFTVLLPDTGHDEAYEILNKIKEACGKFNSSISNNEKFINLSLGFGTKESIDGSLEEAEKEAEDYLRKRKLFEQKSYHNSVLASIMATMYARSQETEEHSLRMSKYCRLMAEKMNLPQKTMDELHLYAMLHDIGKVGIDDRILSKPGKLTDEEWEIMKTHSEIGSKIAQASPELGSVSEYILTHHERWDGGGYPAGMRGEEIPLLSRILSIADAYDAMTEDRIYRKALTKEAALEEIMENSGKQFDPGVAKIFVDLMRASTDSQYRGY